MQVAKGGALGADIALAPDVVRVGSNFRNATRLNGNRQAAHGLAQVAGSDMGSVFHDALDEVRPVSHAPSPAPRPRSLAGAFLSELV